MIRFGHWTTRRGFGRDQSGIAAVEFALILPIMTASRSAKPS